MNIDMHTHSKYSHDSLASIDKMFRVAKKKELDGIALTDHQSADGWPDGIRAAKKHEMFFIKAQEIRTYDEYGTDLGDILCFFLKKEIETQNIFEVVDLIKEQDALLFFAHPFDKIKPHYGLKAEQYVKHFDGAEVFNSTVKKEYNKKALVFARKHKLMFSAGSDAHVSMNVGNAYVEANASSLEEFRKKLVKKQVKIHGKKSSKSTKFISQIAKLRAL